MLLSFPLISLEVEGIILTILNSHTFNDKHKNNRFPLTSMGMARSPLGAESPSQGM
jgi:hypothetical protein